jgi:hypothetical protein
MALPAEPTAQRGRAIAHLELHATLMRVQAE